MLQNSYKEERYNLITYTNGNIETSLFKPRFA
jgi:hypothetical protein